jgi:hypothetical protein
MGWREGIEPPTATLVRCSQAHDKHRRYPSGQQGTDHDIETCRPGVSIVKTSMIHFFFSLYGGPYGILFRITSSA